VLHDNGSRRLIHDRAALASRDAGFFEAALGLHRGEPFVHQSDGNRGRLQRKLVGKSRSDFRRATGFSGQSKRKPNQDFQRFILLRECNYRVQIAFASLHGLNRDGKRSARIGPGDANSNAPDVDTDPHT
jgi:hypothetical protein